MRVIKLFFVILIVWTNVSLGAKILCIASMPTFSHNLFFRPIWKALADRGHHLTVLTADPMKEPYPNIREINMSFAYERKKILYTSASAPTGYNLPFVYGRYLDMFKEVATAELDSPDVQKLLSNKTEHFDLVIAEMHITVMFGLSHRFKCPMIGISSVDVFNRNHNILVLTLWTNVSFSADILCIASMASFSHNLFFRPIWKALADKGHKLTVLTTNPMDQPYPNIREIDMGCAYERTKSSFTSASTPTRFNWPFVYGWRYLDMFKEVATAELDSPDVQKLLNNKTEHFDLVIAEMHINVMFGFAHRFKCPSIGISSLDVFNKNHEILGNPTHFIQYPEMCGNVAAKQLSFEERAIALYNGIGIYIQEYRRKEIWNEMLRKYFGPDVPPLEDLLRSIYFVFLNVHPLINYRPLGPKFVPIGGGSHITPPKPLGKELQALLDSNPQGVVYFSLGSSVKDSQISHILSTAVEAFKELPYQFIWKLGLNIPNLPENIKIFSWLPQQDLLRHPNVKAFIFQGGIHSKEEAIHAKIPMVGIPIMSDQHTNVDDLVTRGLGVFLDKDNLSKEGLKGAIKKVIEDPSFKENLNIYSQLLHDSPQPGIEKAVWHVEFALRNPQGAQLMGQSFHLPWYQYYFLDVFIVILVTLGTIIGLFWWIVLLLMNFFRSRRNLNKVKVN